MRQANAGWRGEDLSIFRITSVSHDHDDVSDGVFALCDAVKIELTVKNAGGE